LANGKITSIQVPIEFSELAWRNVANQMNFIFDDQAVFDAR
jgi:hypothetical protein